jgi:hypothetical protein
VSVSVQIATGAVEVIRTSPIVDVNGNPLTGLTNIKLAVVRDSDSKPLDFSNNTFTAGPAMLYAVMSELDAARFPGVYSYSLNTGGFVNPNPNDKYKVYISQQGATNAANALQTGELRVMVVDAVNSTNAAVPTLATSAGLTSAVAPLATSAALSSVQADTTAIKGANFTPGQDDLHSLHGTVLALPAGVWATAEGGSAGTALYNLTLVRKFITNEMIENTSASTLTLLDDNGTPLKTWGLVDSTGGPVTTQTGEPAHRKAAI